jgi:hypothetical protein
MTTVACRFRRFASLLLVPASLVLCHCSAETPSTWTDPNNASPAAGLEVQQPIDASGHVAENPVGQPVTVVVAMTQTGPGTCTDQSSLLGCGSIGNTSPADCTVCSGPETALDFQLTAIGCDQDLCDVVGIQQGDAATGDTVTIVPHAGFVTVRATAQSGSLVASGSVSVAASCEGATNVPGCN